MGINHLLQRSDQPRHSQEYIVTGDGKTLFTRKWKGNKDAPVVFIGHTQPTHSGHFIDFGDAMNARGWNVHAGDVRAHGNSTGCGVKLAHLDAENGWDDLVEDMRLLINRAFENVPFEKRVLAVQNVSALLVLELLKTMPDLAKHIVLSAPANQKIVALIARAFVSARRKLKSDDIPDEHTQYHVYNFLGARLSAYRHKGDVMSANEELVDRIIEDPLAFPPPTLGYWAAIFKGYDQAWNWPKERRINPETRFLLLNGVEDAAGHGGRAKSISAWLRNTGADDITFYQVEGGRTAILLDEQTLNISSIVSEWVDEGSTISSSEIDMDLNLQSIAETVLERMGSSDLRENHELGADELIALCYDAIEDENKWIEILYRMSLSASDDEPESVSKVEQMLLALMPHWERSYKLNRQMMNSTALSIVLQSVIDRLDIGTALISDDHRVLYFNNAFEVSLKLINGTESKDNEDINRRLACLLDGDVLKRIRSQENDIVLTHDGHPVGFFFKPEAIKRQPASNGPSGMIVLRTQAEGETSKSASQLSMLELAYGFTSQEAIVALEIANGLSPSAIAEKLGVSINTIRTHLKKTYEKMDVEGQTELAARILSGPIGWLAS